MQQLGISRTLSAVVVAIAVAGCGSITPSPSPSASLRPSPALSPSPVPTLVADGSAWVPAGTLAQGRASTHAVTLSDGRVLVVGSDNICTPGGAWDESAAAEMLIPQPEPGARPRASMPRVTASSGSPSRTGVSSSPAA